MLFFSFNIVILRPPFLLVDKSPEFMLNLTDMNFLLQPLSETIQKDLGSLQSTEDSPC